MKTREEMRFEAAKAAMSGMLANDDWLKCAISLAGKSGESLQDLIANSSAEFADALLAELDRTAPKPEPPQPDKDGWIPHKPGDPMPCDGDLRIIAKLRDGSTGDSWCAEDFRWDAAKKSEDPEYDIIAWKPA